MKVTLGCGMAVAPGWLNIDASLNAFITGLPRWAQNLAYRFSGSRQFYSQDFYCSTLRDNVFVHHNLSYGIPLDDGGTATHQRVQTRHQTFRRAQVCVPDLGYAWALYQRGEKELMPHDFFFTDSGNSLGRHRYAYDYDMLADVLKSAGFAQVCRREFQQGWTPDIDVLDNRAEYSLYVEAPP